MNDSKLDAFAELSKAFRELSVSTREACESMRLLCAYIPPFTEEDIQLVSMNPSLSLIEKYKIIRSMRKQMKGR